MPYTIRKLPDEPIVIFKLGATYNTQLEREAAVRNFLGIIEHVEAPIFLMIDASDMEKMGLDDIMVGSASAARGENALFHHPNIRQIVIVTRNPAFRMAAEGLGYDVYGNLFVPVYENIEDALAFARGRLSEC